MLYENPKLTYDQFVENKHSTHSELADRILPDVHLRRRARNTVGTDRAKLAADVLPEKWDRHSECGPAAEQSCF